MNWQDTPLIDSTPRDVDEKLKDILLSRLMGLYTPDVNGEFVPVNGDESPFIDQFIKEIKDLFKVDGNPKPSDEDIRTA